LCAQKAAPETPPPREAYLDCVGHTALKAELGEALPNGAGVRVTQVEGHGPEGRGPQGWTPDPGRPQFRGKRFLMPSLPSEHATDVASRFYGNASMAPGVSEIECYPNGVWAVDMVGFLRTGRKALPLCSKSRVANHSWVGRTGHKAHLEVLKRVDYVVATDDFIQVAGADNSLTPPDLLQSAYNPIIVGRTDGHHSRGTTGLGETLYCTGRAKPDIVAPARFTSTATPIVASACAMLISFAHQKGLSICNGSYNSQRSGQTIYHAETSEVIKAALMAGADRSTSVNPARLGNIRDYRRPRARQTDNGLDRRYGAGQLNVRNSYHILAAGERDSAQDSAGGGDGRGGRVGPLGFDYDPAFGGASESNSQASYSFKAPAARSRLKSSLAWNIKVNDSQTVWDGNAALHDLDLKLYDLDRSDVLPVARSTSWVDNTENIWFELTPGHKYELRVVVAKGQDEFLWDYALAWQIEGQ